MKSILTHSTMRRISFKARGVAALLAVALVTLVPTAGAATTAVLVKDINPGTARSLPTRLSNVNGTLFFGAGDGTLGTELWKSDGTAAGTVLVKDINPGSGDSFPGYPGFRLTDVSGGTALFSANDGSHGEELWKSDGTTAGTVLVKDINPDSATSFPSFLTNVNGTVFFSADDGSHGTELWKSDGTAAGTVLVKDINPSSLGSFPAGFGDLNGAPAFANVNGTVFFSANDGTHGTELWKSDGTDAGTVMVEDINPTDFTSPGPYDLTVVNGTVFFGADDGTHGWALWRSNGTAAGTVLVKDINPSASQFTTPGFLDNLTDVTGTLMFRADDGTNGSELWKSDGTAAGTVLVKDINAGLGNSFPSYFTVVNSTLFFGARDGIHGFEPWKTDGTTAGTALLKDINPGTADSLIDEGLTPMLDVNGTLFLAAGDGTHGIELWKSDGTEAGTVLVQDINPGAPNSKPGGIVSGGGLVNVNGTLFLRADDGTHGSELWKTQEIGTGGSADLSITITDSPDPVTVDAGLDYTLTVSNAGPDGASDVSVTDTLPGSVTFLSAAASQGSCSESAGTVSCSLGAVASAGTATVTIHVTPNSAGTITNDASVSSSTSDPNSANNSDAEDTVVVTGIDGSMNVIVTGSTKSSASGGSRKVFVTRVCNVGTVNATLDPAADLATSITVNGAPAGGTVTLLSNPALRVLKPGRCRQYKWRWSYGTDGPANPGDTVVYQATWNLAGDSATADNTDSETRIAS